ncbi:hypothetical protein B0H17DRAFT_584836 [Mycena rosella]|uniref:Uncharacterized protein n=1 Tax=Mycena rosella TaxID=1033263 RepID=A0AAD7DIY6_MYCRO|nr:hypothetical protein B0H17DRAFT_584836 [Mycena rosella]
MVTVPFILVVGFIVLNTPARSQRLHNSDSLIRARESIHSVRDETLNNVVRRAPPASVINTVTIGASVAIGASALLLAMVFAVLWKRLHRKPQPNVELGRSRRPIHLRVETDFPAEMKPAYLDSPRPRRASVVAREPLSPLMASLQPGFVPRPIPANVPTSVAESDVASSMQFNPHQSPVPEDLADVLNELSRHYILTDPASPGPRHAHQYSESLTGRSRVFQPYSP